jgi:hypothetical protein
MGLNLRLSTVAARLSIVRIVPSERLVDSHWFDVDGLEDWRQVPRPS